MKPLWDARYDREGYVYGSEPNEFLAEHAKAIPVGRVLCLADGEGRNGVFLAKLGYRVLSVDLSQVGLRKARELAEANEVSIETEVADLATYSIEPGAWDGIVSIFAHLPTAIRRPLHEQVVHGLLPGGAIILEAFTVRQLEMEGKGGPSAERADSFMSIAALREELAGLSFDLAHEIDREVNEGLYHSGRCAVVQVLARKPDAQ